MAWLRGYDRSLKVVLRHKFATLMVSFVVIGLTFYLFTISKTGFIPDEDQGLVFAFTEAQQGIAFQDMMQLQQKVADVVRFDPNVMNIMSSIGNPINQGRIFFRLKDKKDRVNHMSAMEVIQELRPKVSQIPGLNVFMQIPPTIRIGGSLTKSQYQYTLQSPDTTELYQDAPKLESALRALPQLQDVTSDLQVKNPQLTVEVDHDKAYALGLTPAQVSDALYSAYGTRQISTIYTPNNEYYVIVELLPEFQNNPDKLSLLYVRSSAGKLVPLDTVAKLVPSVGPADGESPGPVAGGDHQLQPQARNRPGRRDQSGRSRGPVRVLPGDIQGTFQGTAQAFQELIHRHGPVAAGGDSGDLHHSWNSV